MKIGFDAYFSFHFKTGVSHYGRNLVNSLAGLYPDTELVLFTDRRTGLYQPEFPNVRIVETGEVADYHRWLEEPRLISAIESEKPNLFHGLDHGLPALRHIRSVVTVHDLFFESHPQLYSAADVAYYRRVTPLACNLASRIIAISDFTRDELVQRYGVPREKIGVCYQTCNQLFFQPVPEQRKAELRKHYQLPEVFWLYVGAVSERKNLLKICEALHINRDRSAIPLVVIGEGDAYLQQVRDFLEAKDLSDRVLFISYTEQARQSLSFQQARDVPAFYQMALALLYPSYLEGFGIPLIESFASGTPVITAASGSLPEIGGNAACYVDPFDARSIAEALLKLESDPGLRASMISRGRQILPNFTAITTASAIMKVYREML
ncbi:MAG TPA: glycosyltransferase family 1 protein [Chitinophagaceae bacterium]